MNLALGTEEETSQMRDRIKQLATPVCDPIYGKEGPMPRIWKKE